MDVRSSIYIYFAFWSAVVGILTNPPMLIVVSLMNWLILSTKTPL